MCKPVAGWNVLDKYIPAIEKALNGTTGVFPAKENIFKALSFFPPTRCNAVVLAQDPYPQRGRATGLAFANDVRWLDDLSPSLKVVQNSIRQMYLDKGEDLPIFDVTFENWEKQGILMLNSALTVRENAPGSHQAFWNPVIEDVLKFLSGIGNIFFCLLGRTAQDFAYSIDPSKNLICYDFHPAFYARKGEAMSYRVWDEMRKYVKEKRGITLSL